MGRSTEEELGVCDKNPKIEHHHDRESRRERKRLGKLEKQRPQETKTRPIDKSPLLVQDTDPHPAVGEKRGEGSISAAGCATSPPEQTELTLSDHISRLYESQSELTKEAAELIQDETARVIQFAKKQLKKDRKRLRQQWDRELQALRDAITREQEDRQRALTYYKKRVFKDARTLCRHYDRRVGRLQFMLHLERTYRLKSEKKLRNTGKNVKQSGGWCHDSKVTESHEATPRLAGQPSINAGSQVKHLGEANEPWKLEESHQSKPSIKSESLAQVSNRRDISEVKPWEAQPSDDASTCLSYLENQHERHAQHIHTEALSVLQFLVPYFPACHNPVLMDGSCSGCKTWLDSSASAPLLAVAQLANGLWTAMSPGCSNTVLQPVHPESGRVEAAGAMLTPSSPPPSPLRLADNTAAMVSEEQQASTPSDSLPNAPVNQPTASAMKAVQRVLKKPTRSKLEQCAILLNQSRRVAKRKGGPVNS